MAITAEKLRRIVSNPAFPKTGDDGFELSDEDEKILDRAWADMADREVLGQNDE